MSSQNLQEENIILFFLGTFLIVFSGIMRQGVAQGEMSLFIEGPIDLAVYRNPMISITSSAITQILLMQYQSITGGGISVEQDSNGRSYKVFKKY